MASWKTIDILCSNESCQHKWDALIDRSEEENEFQCPECGASGKKTLSAPMVFKEAYHDGIKRLGWDKLREASKLNLEAAGSRDKNRKEIQKEIKKLGVNISKDPT